MAGAPSHQHCTTTPLGCGPFWLSLPQRPALAPGQRQLMFFALTQLEASKGNQGCIRHLGAMGGANLAGIAVIGTPHQAAESVLTPDALAFVARLARSVHHIANPIAQSLCQHGGPSRLQLLTGPYMNSQRLPVCTQSLPSYLILCFLFPAALLQARIDDA